MRLSVTILQVIVFWSAKWCSLTASAASLFEHVAGMHRNPGSGMRFVTVNLDVAEVCSNFIHSLYLCKASKHTRRKVPLLFTLRSNPAS